MEDSTMKHTVMTMLVLTLTSVPPNAQTHPDFSGQWLMDASRSESAVQNEPIGPTTIVIKQSPTEMEMTVSRDGTTALLTYRLDGAPSAIPNGTATSHWEGGALVTESVRTIQGQTVTTKETRRLNPAQDEMTTETILVVQHGYTLSGARNYGAGKDVFVRAR
jgi:hypothetical protein